MLEIIGPSNRILEIDLSAQTTEEFSVSKADRRMYLGGKGLGLKLMRSLLNAYSRRPRRTLKTDK